MKTTQMRAVVFTGLVLTGFAAAQQPRQPEIDLQAAMRKENVEGDLSGAIKQYGAIVTKYKSDRAVAARALVRMAECYQKMGNAEARKIYEQIVKDYSDQKDAVAIARASLGSQQARTNTLVWTPPKADDLGAAGSISPDGRYFSFVDWGTGDLALHNFATGTDRYLTNQGLGKRYQDFAEDSVISKDGKQIAFTWYNSKTKQAEARLGNLSGDFNPRILYANQDVNWVTVCDWSPDNKLLAVELSRRDHTKQIALVSVPDGAMRVLKSVDWRGADKIMFSPDGKYLGYDLPASDTRSQRDVFVLSVDGSRDASAVADPSDDTMMGWSADGKWLLFASDRMGLLGLWGVRFADGKPSGVVRLLRADLPSRAESAGMTRYGALYYARFPVGGNRSRIYTASFDFAAGRFLSAPADISEELSTSNSAPAWLPDGKRLSYSVQRGPVRNPELVLAIRSLETGEVREIYPKLAWFDDGKWSSDGRFFLTRGRDLKGRSGIFRIDASSGDAMPLVLDEEGENALYPVLAPDGTSFFFPREHLATKERALIQRDLATGMERVLLRGRYVGGVNVSPDGRYMVAGNGDPATNSWLLSLISLEGGEIRELIRMPSEVPADKFASAQGVSFSNSSWAPDSRSVLVWKKRQGPNASELWQVFIDGKPPRKIDAPAIAVRSNLPFVVNPDGTHLAFRYTERTPQDNGELWALDHFLPEDAEKK